jgi:hypothetical protein
MVEREEVATGSAHYCYDVRRKGEVSRGSTILSLGRRKGEVVDHHV